MSSPPACQESSPPQLPISTSPTSLDECFFFNSWLSDFHTVWFSVSSCCFLVLNLLLSFFWLCEKINHTYLCLHPGQKSMDCQDDTAFHVAVSLPSLLVPCVLSFISLCIAFTSSFILRLYSIISVSILITSILNSASHRLAISWSLGFFWSFDLFFHLGHISLS